MATVATAAVIVPTARGRRAHQRHEQRGRCGAVRKTVITRAASTPPDVDDPASAPPPAVSMAFMDALRRRFRSPYDVVGRWLVEHPAPQILVNNPLKRWVTKQMAGGEYDPVAAKAMLAELVANDDVVVFSATYCPFSAAAKAALRTEGVPFVAHEWNTMSHGASLVAALGDVYGRTSIPQVFIGGVNIGGCNDGGPGIRPLIAGASGGLDLALERCGEETRAARARVLAKRQKM